MNTHLQPRDIAPVACNWNVNSFCQDCALKPVIVLGYTRQFQPRITRIAGKSMLCISLKHAYLLLGRAVWGCQGRGPPVLADGRPYHCHNGASSLGLGGETQAHASFSPAIPVATPSSKYASTVACHASSACKH